MATVKCRNNYELCDIIEFIDGCKKIQYRSGSEVWYDSIGRLHKEDGPAAVFIRGEDKIKMCEKWFYQGIKIVCSSQEEFEKFLEMKAFW